MEFFMKKFLIVVVIVVFAILALVYWGPAGEVSLDPSDDTTSGIEKDLGSIEVGELDADFDSLDGDINSL